MAFEFAYRNPAPAPAPADHPALSGCRVALQPNLSVADWPTEAGSHALTGFRALEDATLAARLRRHGAGLCGLTAMSEFGFGLHGSQAGAAVQNRAADAELVLDVTGESRLAARNAGLWGFKPGYGLLSRAGVIGLMPSLECCGLLAAKPSLLRDLLQALAGPDERDFSLPEDASLDAAPPAVDPGRTVVGIPAATPGGWLPADDRPFQAAVASMRAMGFAVRELPLPDPASFALVHRIVGSVEASSCLGRYDSVRYGPRAPGAKNWNEMYLRSRGEAFGPLLKALLFQGAYFQFERYAAYDDACRIRARLVAEMERLAAQADFLMIPAGDDDAQTAPPGTLDRHYAQFSRTLCANVTGQPALLAPPAGTGGAACQFIAPRGGDLRLLALADTVGSMGRGGDRHGR